MVESYEYTAYGETKVLDSSGTELSESALSNRYTFQGREIDWATSLTYFRARWYDSASGRWFSKDPVGIYGGLNQFEFCANDPVNFRDPMGEDVVLRGAGKNDGYEKHMKIQLQYTDESGNPEHYTLSFGMKTTLGNLAKMALPWIKQAEVYYEKDCDGPEQKRLKLTPEEDKKVLEWMKNMEGKKMHFDALLNNCRHFSKGAYQYVEEIFKGK
ncbi:RHS repeat domain-containing protein [Pontiella sp.]|uniref:RHS repeat domain-containing protein n=1 Tax=Pontiella sp. TaxID=2837462 RepID=UPI003569AEB3